MRIAASVFFLFLTVAVAASLGHVAHEGGREDVLEPPGSGPQFELLGAERHDFRASSDPL